MAILNIVNRVVLSNHIVPAQVGRNDVVRQNGQPQRVKKRGRFRATTKLDCLPIG